MLPKIRLIEQSLRRRLFFSLSQLSSSQCRKKIKRKLECENIFLHSESSVSFRNPFRELGMECPRRHSQADRYRLTYSHFESAIGPSLLSKQGSKYVIPVSNYLFSFVSSPDLSRFSIRPICPNANTRSSSFVHRVRRIWPKRSWRLRYKIELCTIRTWSSRRT